MDRHTCFSVSPMKAEATLLTHIPSTLHSSWAASAVGAQYLLGEWKKKE